MYVHIQWDEIQILAFEIFEIGIVSLSPPHFAYVNTALFDLKVCNAKKTVLIV